MNVYLDRHAYTRWGTLGHLRIGGEVIPTLEPPWRDNARFLSCIPEGTYRMQPQHSPKFRRILWELSGVHERSEILLHAGNTVADTTGCILVGTRLTIENGGFFLHSGQRGERRLAAMLADVQSAIIHIGRAEDLGRLTLPPPPCGH